MNAPKTIDDVLRHRQRLAHRAKLLTKVAPEAREIHDEYGWTVALAWLLGRIDGATNEEVAAVFETMYHCSAVALRRSGVAEFHDRTWRLVPGTPAAEAAKSLLAEDRRAQQRADRDRHLVAPWRRSDGKMITVRYGVAMAALFADGATRTSREVTYVTRGNDATSQEVAVTRGALARCTTVESAGKDLWRRVPTVDELRARVAELEAEVERLKGATKR